MRGFVTSALGVVLLLLLFHSYSAWNGVKDLDRANTEYILLLKDVEQRTLLENQLYRGLKSHILTCLTELSSGSADVVLCNDRIESYVLTFAALNGLYTCPHPVVFVPPKVRFVCDVVGEVGRAKFLIPSGAEVVP